MNTPPGVADVNAATLGTSEVRASFRAWEFGLTRVFGAFGTPIGDKRAYSTSAMLGRMEERRQQLVTIGGVYTCPSALAHDETAYRKIFGRNQLSCQVRCFRAQKPRISGARSS